ncbi:MAG: hypothetical protein ORO03_04450 [Alphaproteobacteria bacterium]|nr:hypothetical protein [Alphaproteobacteria bacterium]
MREPKTFLALAPTAVGLPLASVPLTYSLPESVGLYRLKTAIIELITDANVANRQVTLTITDRNGNIKARAGASVVQTASLDIIYNFGLTGSPYQSPVVLDLNVPMQGIIATPGDRYRFQCANAAAGDTWGPEGAFYFEADDYV